MPFTWRGIQGAPYHLAAHEVTCDDNGSKLQRGTKSSSNVFSSVCTHCCTNQMMLDFFFVFCPNNGTPSVSFFLSLAIRASLTIMIPSDATNKSGRREYTTYFHKKKEWDNKWRLLSLTKRQFIGNQRKYHHCLQNPLYHRFGNRCSQSDSGWIFRTGGN